MLTRKKYQQETKQSFNDSTNTTEKQFEYLELENTISSLIEEMPKKRKETYKQSRFEGLTYIEIATRLSISENTVDTQIRKALLFLKRKLSNYSFMLIFVYLTFFK